MEWLVEEFSYVKKGDSIHDLTRHGYICHADKSGFLVCLHEKWNYPGDRVNMPGEITSLYSFDYFYPYGFKIVDDLGEYIRDCLLPSDPQIQMDEFSGKPTITWNKFRETKPRFDNTACLRIKDEFGFMFECIDGEALISFSTIDNKTLPFKKKDFVSFLFEDSSVAKFELKKVSKLKKVSTAKCSIHKEEIEHFLTQKVKTIKLSFNDDRTPEVYNLENLLGAEVLSRAVMMHAQEFMSIMSTANVELPSSQTDSADIVSTAESCYVYLMLDSANDLYKIGISKSPTYREKTLQSEKPSILQICSKEYPHRIIAAAIEKALHEAFDRKRVRGEWFNLSADEVNLIIKTLT